MSRMAARCRSTVNRWSSERLHIWPACGLSAAVGALAVALLTWLVAASGRDCMTTCEARIDVDSVVGGLVMALRAERNATVSSLDCSTLAFVNHSTSANISATSIADLLIKQKVQITDYALNDVARLFTDRGINTDVISKLQIKVNTTRMRCRVNDGEANDDVVRCHDCAMDFDDVIITSALVLPRLSETDVRKQVQSIRECDEIRALLEHYENCLLLDDGYAGIRKAQNQCSASLDTHNDPIEAARSICVTWSSKRTLNLALLPTIFILLCTLSPLLCLLYSHTCTTLVTSITDRMALLDEQAKELAKDTKRIEGLLYQLLPAPIVDDLKTHKSVLAESYKLVTIYFSDIVGFTTISASSSAMQVVQFLNKLYTEFDARIDLYDVYKVETIGDAYVIVSGCPRTNGISHAGEISMLALDLLHMTHNFQIPHKPDQKLMLRIGLHSGPCLAGVVGDKMPRYCLFGETVSIASRMESTGQALRIQISEDCKNLLDQLGVYIYDERGQVEIKENVFINTYWLTGKDGYRFKVDKDVCVFIPKKVKLDRVVVKKK